MLLHTREELVCLTEAAVAVALSVLLGSIRLLELPSGGSIALATVPLLALALTRGVRVGVLAGVCAGAAHALSGGTIIHPAQLVLDYLAAYALLGLAGVAAGRVASAHVTSVAIIAAMSAHLAAMVLSGVIFFAPVAGSAALGYSLAYNAATVVPETLLALWLVPGLMRAAARADPAAAWRGGLLDPPVRHPRSARRIHAGASIDIRIPAVTSPPGATPSTLTPRAEAGACHAPSTLAPSQRGTLVRSPPLAGTQPFSGGWLRDQVGAS